MVTTTGNLILKSIFPFENENQWESEVQNKMPAELNFNSSLYQDMSTDVSVSDARICKKDINQENQYMAFLSHLTISYSIFDNRLMKNRYCCICITQ